MFSVVFISIINHNGLQANMVTANGVEKLERLVDFSDMLTQKIPSVGTISHRGSF